MLPPFIIEQIRKREADERIRYEQPVVEIPIPRPRPRSVEAPVPDDEPRRGIIILEL